MQTRWAECVCSAVLLFSLLLAVPADPLAFFPASLCVFYWWALRAAVFSKAACQQTLSSQQPSLFFSIPFRQPCWIPHTIFTQKTHKCTNAECLMHTARTRRAWLKALCVSGGWEMSQLELFNVFEFLGFFLSLWREKKTRYCEARPVCQLISLFGEI